MVRSLARLVWLACIVAALGAGSPGAVVAYHGQDGSYHQAQWDALVPQGYRLISLSIYGNPSSPVYAAVWIQRAGPAFVGAHGIDGSEYQDLFDTYTPLGYVPTIVSACGDNGAEARYACFFEQLNVGGVAGVHGATEQTYRDQNTWARDNNYRLVWVDIYGTAGNPLYCASWVPNHEVQAWNYSVGESGADYQKRYDAYEVQWIRPALTSVSAAIRYTSVWVDDVLPGGYVALHGLSPQQYQDAFDFWTGEGLIPIRVDAGGEGNDARFAAIFANTDLPMAREWYVTGFPTTGLDDFDTAMLDFMQEKGIRGGALAITKDCRLVLARGYTWAEPGYPVTQPDNLFRIASCSKPITGIGIMQLVEEGRLGLDENIVDVVNMTTLPGESWHSFLDDVRIRDLLVHAGGWDIGETGLGYDPMFHNIEVRDAVGGTLPITKYQIELYMNGQPMQFFPGSDSIYSNYGFSLLGQAIEVRRSSAAFLTYEQAIKAYVFNPLGATRPRIGRTLQGLAAPGEVRYHGIRPSISSSVMSEDRPWLPTQYGGYNVENFDAHGGWIMAAPDFAKVMSAFDDDGGVLMDGDTLDALLRDSTGFGNTRRGWFRGTTADGVVAYGHNGSIHASSAMQWWREDKISFTVFFNKDVSPALWFAGHTLGDTLNKIAGELNGSGGWPGNDWFGRLGLPTCVPSPTPTPTNTPRPTNTPTNTPRITNTPTPSSTPTGTPGPGFRWGDMDDSGVTGTLDAALILQWDAFLIDDFPCCPGVTRPSYPPRADVSDDGTLGAVDASQILQWDAFLLNCFPADTDCDEFGPE